MIIMGKSKTGRDTAQNKSESEIGMEIKDDTMKPVDETRPGALGRNPLGAISRTGLEGLISSGSKKPDGKKPDSIEQELLFTKAVKLTLDDVEFVKDMAIAVKSEGNFSEGIRACIRAARKQYGDDVKELAARRKSSEVVNI